MDDTGRCRVCFQASFSEENGVRICDVCGTQTLDIVTFNEADDALKAGPVRQIREVRDTARGGPVVAEKYRVADVVELYINCLQALLQAGLEALERDCGLSADVWSIARRLWLVTVARSRMLDDDFISALEDRVERQARRTPQEGDEPLEEAEQHTLPTVRGESMVVGHVLEAAFPRENILVVIYLSTWIAREAVAASDLIHWALSGQLPFLHMAPHAAHVIAGAAPVELPLLLLDSSSRNRSGVPSVPDLTLQAAAMAQDLGLSLPAINAAAWLQRFVEELCLPKIFIPAALELFMLHRMGSPVTHLSGDPSENAHAEVMAALIVALKMIYGLELEEKLRPALPPRVPPPPDWGTWAGQAMKDLAKPSAFPLTPQEATGLSDLELQEYLTYLSQNIFVYPPPEGFGEFQRLFTRIGERPQTSAQPQTFPLPTDRPHCKSPPSAEEEEEGKDMEEDVKHHIMADRMHSPEDASQEEKLYRLFPRLHHALDVSTTWSSPDYAALLAVAAACLWLTPVFLQTKVCMLEMDMARAEAAVATGAVAAPMSSPGSM